MIAIVVGITSGSMFAVFRKTSSRTLRYRLHHLPTVVLFEIVINPKVLAAQDAFLGVLLFLCHCSGPLSLA